jgi:preprotein translocase subunit SecG
LRCSSIKLPREALTVTRRTVCYARAVRADQGEQGRRHGAAFGGGATQQVFGGRGAGNILTRATAVCAAIFMLTSVSLAYVSSSGDRELKSRIVEEQRKSKGNEGTRVKTPKPKPPAARAETAPGTGEK